MRYLWIFLCVRFAYTDAEDTIVKMDVPAYFNCTNEGSAPIISKDSKATVKGKLFFNFIEKQTGADPFKSVAGEYIRVPSTELVRLNMSGDQAVNGSCTTRMKMDKPHASNNLFFEEDLQPVDAEACMKAKLDYLKSIMTLSAKPISTKVTLLLLVDKTRVNRADWVWSSSPDVLENFIKGVLEHLSKNVKMQWTVSIYVVENDNEATLNVGKSFRCTLTNKNVDEEQTSQESLLNNFSRTSVLFVSVSFIILMVISLAWLVFYYVQRFRYAHAKDRLQRRLFNAAKKALTKIPAKTLRQGDKELDSDCPVCIEPYHACDVIRTLPCKHVFHKTCVDPWLLEHRTCPMCKMDILKAFGYHFTHSEESVRDVDQLSAGGQSTDGGSGTGSGRRGSNTHHSFPMSLPTDSDLQDPFFPSPIPSPSLLQPVLHSSQAQTFTIIPLTLHRQSDVINSVPYMISSGARGSESSSDSSNHWATTGAAQRQHSAEVHRDSNMKIAAKSDDNHNTMIDGPYDAADADNEENNARASQSASSSSSSIDGQQRQPLFHSRSASALRAFQAAEISQPVDCEKKPPQSTKLKKERNPFPEVTAVIRRGRSASHGVLANGHGSAVKRTRVAVSTTPPPLYSKVTTTTTTLIGESPSSSTSSMGSDCVTVGMIPAKTGGRRKMAPQTSSPNASASVESL